MNKQSLLKGATILAIAGIVVKGMGAIFRIPLVNWIGDVGMANYSPAYSIYAFLVIIATSGLPVAISKMVSESVSVGNYNQAHKVFKISSRFMMFLGVVFFAILFIFAPNIAVMMKNPDAALGMRAIAPALICVPIMAAYRGYFQGMQNMKPTALSQVVEQLFRVVVGLGAAYILFFKVGNGFIKGFDKYAQGAAGANLGATAGSLGGLLMILFIYMLARKGIHRKIVRSKKMKVDSTNQIIKKVMIIAVPITIGAAINPILNLVDSALVMNRLTEAAGFSNEVAKELYGQLSGFVGSLVNLPQLLTQAVAVSIVPIVAAAYKLKQRRELHENIQLGLRVSVIIGYPCAFGLLTLAKPILLFLYPNQAESAANAASILAIMAIGVIFLATTQTATGILQGVGKQMVPVNNMLIGMVVKIVFTWVLVGIPAINVNGAAIGTVLAFFVTVALNLRSVIKYTKVSIDIGFTFIRPLISSAAMAIVVFVVYKLLFMIISHNSIATLVSIVFGVVTYGIMIFVTKSIKVEELEVLPKGDKIAKVVSKFIK